MVHCEKVWKVFGAGAERVITEHGASVSDETLARHELIAAVRDVSLSVHRGEIFVIMGLSGSGKSTLVRCMTGLIGLTLGRLLIDDTDLMNISIPRSGGGATLQDGHGLPGLRPAAPPHGARQRRLPAQDPGGRAKRPGGTGPRDDRARGLERARALLPARALGRAAATGRHRPKPHHRARDLVPRRALLRSGSPDPPRDAGRAPAPPGDCSGRPSCSSPTISTRRSSSPTASRS